MPINLKYNRETGVTTAVLSGLLTRLDYRRVMPYLESVVTDHGRLRLFLVFENFEGWAPPELQGEALNYLGELRQVMSLAICADAEWQLALIVLLERAGSERSRLFSSNDREAAMNWLIGSDTLSERASAI